MRFVWLVVVLFFVMGCIGSDVYPDPAPVLKCVCMPETIGDYDIVICESPQPGMLRVVYGKEAPSVEASSGHATKILTITSYEFPISHLAGEPGTFLDYDAGFAKTVSGLQVWLYVNNKTVKISDEDLSVSGVRESGLPLNNFSEFNYLKKLENIDKALKCV